MSFDFENPYIEFDSIDIPFSLYEIHGLNKISELSRQLRKFINYKTATIQYRFRPKNILCRDRIDKKYEETKRALKHLSSKFIKLLFKIRGSGTSYEAELKRLLERVKFTRDKFSHDLLTDLRAVLQKLFITIHILSEQEIYIDPKFLKFTVNLTREACTVIKILNNWASGFYEELRVNYHQLHDELAFLIPEKRAEKPIAREHRPLGKGIKGW